MITGIALRDGLISAANNIQNYKNAVNALNVFPVPDGDTGTNMSMTMQAAKKAMETVTDGTDAGTVASLAASAMLRGARGNSGVILSLIFRGFSDGLTGCESANGAIIAAALQQGCNKAYQSISNPTEGTILTVIRAAAEAARNNCTVDIDAADTFEAAYQGAAQALLKTPEMLSVLKKAKVVDAGGQGLCYILLGMLSVFRSGEIIPCKEEEPSAEESPSLVTGEVMSEEDIRFAYCNEFIVKKKEGLTKTADELKAYLQTIGDCVVVVEDDEIIKVHVHSNEPGSVLTAGQEYGEFLTVKVENMKQQHRNAHWGAAEQAEKSRANLPAKPEKTFGFVAVAAGEGFRDLFTQLGADAMVSGGQTMNPSTEELLDAILRVPAEIVYVLPNNKNIILAAKQAATLAQGRRTVILESRSVPQGIAAFLAFSPDEDETTNTEAMEEAMSRIRTVSVTFAARDSFAGGLNIKKGQCMGMEDGKITVVADDPNDAAFRTVKRVAKRSTSVITVYYGDSVTSEKAAALTDAISARYSSAEVVSVNGGQPVYHYLISVE